jgi:hypothetical protein
MHAKHLVEATAMMLWSTPEVKNEQKKCELLIHKLSLTFSYPKRYIQ